MYKFKPIILSLLTMLWLAGCSGGSNPTTSSENTNNSSSPSSINRINSESNTSERSDALNEIIEGAKKEGQVSVTLWSDLEGQGAKNLQRAIKDKYGVDLDLKYTAGGSYPQLATQLTQEMKAGLPPSYDLGKFTSGYIADFLENGFLEKIDWSPILEKGTPDHFADTNGHTLYLYNNRVGLMYNPNEISEDVVPKTWADLADPKWKNKIGMLSYSSTYLRYAFDKGNDTFLPELQAIMKNQPVIDTYANSFTRFSSGEIPMTLIASHWYNNAKIKGIPAAWQDIEMSPNLRHSLTIPKGAKHPNAAKLIAVFLASPDGFEFIKKEVNAGNMFYPDNFEKDIYDLAVKQGIRFFEDSEGFDEWLLTEEGQATEEEIYKILGIK